MRALGFALFSLLSTTAFAADCNYSYQTDSFHIVWTGYKTTKKLGAKGEFKDVKVNAPAAAKNAIELFSKTTVEINPAQVTTGDAARDINLSENFFKKMATPKISGKVKSMDKKSATVTLTMNGVERDVVFNYTNDKNKFSAQGSIDILNFAMEKPLKALSEDCVELHKGPDGVSKTWTTVDIAITATVEETCKK